MCIYSSVCYFTLLGLVVVVPPLLTTDFLSHGSDSTSSQYEKEGGMTGEGQSVMISEGKQRWRVCLSLDLSNKNIMRHRNSS